jgi:hypothetical protein
MRMIGTTAAVVSVIISLAGIFPASSPAVARGEWLASEAVDSGATTISKTDSSAIRLAENAQQLQAQRQQQLQAQLHAQQLEAQRQQQLKAQQIQAQRQQQLQAQQLQAQRQQQLKAQQLQAQRQQQLQAQQLQAQHQQQLQAQQLQAQRQQQLQAQQLQAQHLQQLQAQQAGAQRQQQLKLQQQQQAEQQLKLQQQRQAEQHQQQPPAKPSAVPTAPIPVVSPPINNALARPPATVAPAAVRPATVPPSNVFQGGRPEHSVTLGPCDESAAGVNRTNCPPTGPSAVPPVPPPLVMGPTIEIILPPVMPPLIGTPDQPPFDTPPLIETDLPPLVAPPIIETNRRSPPLPPFIGTDRPPPALPPLIDTTNPPPVIAGPGTGSCVLRFVGQTLFYLRPDLNAVYPVPDLDVARVKCDFSGQASSCLAGFPSNDPDPACRLGPSVVFQGPLQMDHCLYGTIDMSRAINCLPVAWAKTQLLLMDGQLLYVRLDTKTLYPVNQAVADRKGLTDLTNCDSPAIGFCRSMRMWNIGPSVQIDTCLAGTIPMGRRQDCVPPM